MAVFEDQAERNPDVRTRVFCGWIAALTHWRARFSDGMWPAEEPTLDKAATGREVYVETTAQSERQKTGRSRKKARRTVFMVGFFLYGPQMLIGLCGAEIVGRDSVGARASRARRPASERTPAPS